MSTAPDPFDATWVRSSLVPRADRVAGGADPVAEREALFDELSDWAATYADRQVRRLPGHADRHEVRSRLLVAVWESTVRIDWERPTAWPSLLKRRLRGAFLDAARSDDTLSRRDRVEFRRLRSALADWERRHGRTANRLERRTLLEGQRPDGDRFFATLESADRPVDLTAAADEVGGLVEDRADPEAIVTERLRLASVQLWLDEVVPDPLAGQLSDWARRDRAGTRLPRRLAARIEPYVGALARAVHDTPGMLDATGGEVQAG